MALFFLSATKLKDVTILMMKRELTKLGIIIPRGQGHTKDQLLVLLGKELPYLFRVGDYLRWVLIRGWVLN